MLFLAIELDENIDLIILFDVILVDNLICIEMEFITEFELVS